MYEWVLNDPILTGIILTAVIAVVGAIVAAIRYAFKFGKWQGEVNSERTNFRDFMNEIRTDIKRILERLPPTVDATDSPIRLTELGRKVSDELRAGELAQNIAGELRQQVKGKEEHDIQEICLDFAENKYVPDQDVDARIKKIAYDNGIDRRQVLRVIGLELRDILPA